MHDSAYPLFLWEPSVSPHKLGLYRALREAKAFADVTYIAQEGVPAERMKQGWSVQARDDDELIVAPTPQRCAEIVRNSPENAIHIFSGLRHVPIIVAGLSVAISERRHFGIMSEPRDWRGFPGVLRLLQSWATEGPIRRNTRFVLAIGNQGPRWFKRTGYSPRNIYPFAYFIEPTPAPVSQSKSANSPITIGYLGRLEQSKGFDIALAAARRLGDRAIFRVAGSGSLQSLMSPDHRGGQLDYVGVLPIQKVGDFLSGIDILLAPSVAKDGWGASVSEALLSGCAVVTSELVGASVCVSHRPVLGRVIKTPTVDALVDAIDVLASGGLLGEEARKIRHDWATEHLTPNAGAMQLARIVEHVFDGGARPVPYYGDTNSALTLADGSAARI